MKALVSFIKALATFDYVSLKAYAEVIDDLRTYLFDRGLWLIWEGILYGFDETEAAVDRLHVLLHQDLSGRIN